jgi:hypothetical protein
MYNTGTTTSQHPLIWGGPQCVGLTPCEGCCEVVVCSVGINSHSLYMLLIDFWDVLLFFLQRNATNDMVSQPNVSRISNIT